MGCSHPGVTARFTHKDIMVIAPLTLMLACLVAADTVSSAEPIDVDSDYSINPLDRLCHPYCGYDQDQDWDISEGAEVDLINDASGVTVEDRHLTKRSPLVPVPFPFPIGDNTIKKTKKKLKFKKFKKLPLLKLKKKFKKLPLLKFKKKFKKLPLLKFKKKFKLPFKAVKKIPLKKFKKPFKKASAKKFPPAVLAGGTGFAAGSLLGGGGLPSLAGLPSVAGLLPSLPSLPLLLPLPLPLPLPNFGRQNNRRGGRRRGNNRNSRRMRGNPRNSWRMNNGR